MNYDKPPIDLSKLEEEAIGDVRGKMDESTVAEILKHGISLGMLLGKGSKKKMEDDEEGEEEDDMEEEDDEASETNKGDLVAMLLGRREQGMFPMKPRGYQDSMGEPDMAVVKGRRPSSALVISVTPKGKKQNKFFS